MVDETTVDYNHVPIENNWKSTIEDPSEILIYEIILFSLQIRLPPTLLGFVHD